jgi:hypothetical protein
MDSSQEKRCYSCKTVKPLSDFFKNCSKKDGYSYECKQCSSAMAVNSKKNNPITTQTTKMLVNARNRAIKKKLLFDLDIDYVRSLVVSRCPVFNMPLEWSAYRGNERLPLPNSPSLDRIDPTRGYVKGNVWIISHKANMFKSYATHEELKTLTEAVGRAIANSIDW